MIKLIDGSLYQWDTNRKVSITPPEGVDINEVHFANKLDSKAIPVTVKNNEARIPDTLLTSGKDIQAFAVIVTEDGETTLGERVLPVKSKPRPEDYVYTEEERWTAEKAVSDALQKAKESGEFDGDNGVGICNIRIIGKNLAIALTNGEEYMFMDVVGEDGADGKDGIAPQIRINAATNIWEISTDSGVTWTSTNVPATGDKGEKGDKGDAGADGKDADPAIKVFAIKAGPTTSGYMLKDITYAELKELYENQKHLALSYTFSGTGTQYFHCSGLATINGLKGLAFQFCFNTTSKWAFVGEDDSVQMGAVSSQGIALDETLTEHGKAADAKAVGDQLGSIETALDSILAIQNALIGGEAP